MRSADPALHGTPYIVATQQACVVCDDLSCMKACPSGALHLVAKEQIAMGTAHVDLATCVRSRGEPCRECVDRCPIGESALALDARGRVDVRSGCVGCGVCEQQHARRRRARSRSSRAALPVGARVGASRRPRRPSRRPPELSAPRRLVAASAAAIAFVPSSSRFQATTIRRDAAARALSDERRVVGHADDEARSLNARRDDRAPRPRRSAPLRPRRSRRSRWCARDLRRAAARLGLRPRTG